MRFNFYISFILTFVLLIMGLSEVQGQEHTICFNTNETHTYYVDIGENGGEGTTGSTYTWTVTGTSNETMNPVTTSGNQVEINWNNTPVGSYILEVNESDAYSCFNTKQLTIIIEDCACENPASVVITPNPVEICEGETIDLTATLTNATSVTWTTNGDGAFDNHTSETPTYTPGSNDLTNGTVTITATTEDPDGTGVCEAASQQVVVTINPPAATVFASLNDYNVCSTSELPDVSTLSTTDDNGVTGAWAVVDNGNDTHTYTFTPTDTTCYENYSFVVSVTGTTATVFAALINNDVCVISELPDASTLSTTDDNGVAGAWAVVDNADNTHTYTFTPTDTTCYENYSFVVSVTGTTATVFASLNDYNVCSTSELPDISTLSTTDDNGVTGAWAVVDNADNTHTYTFTPTDTTCYENYSFVVSVTGTTATVFASLNDYNVCVISELPDVSTLSTTDDNGVTGAWAVVDNGNDTHTYTFTPTDNTCYTNYSFTISVTGTTATVFASLNDYNVCSTSEFPDVSTLSTTDDNGVTGAWAVLDNGDNTHTYTFTPTDNTCYTNYSFTISVTGTTATVFASLNDYNVCSTSELPDASTLSTTDDNGVAGTWAVVDNADNTHTYTFTPSDNTCYTNYSFTISVTGTTATVFASLNDYNVCSTSELPDVSTLSTTDDNGVAGSWAVVDNGNDTHTYTFTPTDNTCYENYSFTISVTGTTATVFASLNDYNVCSTSELPDISTLSTTDDNGVTGAWAVVDNADNTHTYTFTPTDTTCYENYSFVVSVTGTTATVFASLNDYNVCVISELPDVSTLSTTDDNGVTGAWAVVDNADNTHTYTFTPTDNTCYTNYSFTISVTGTTATVFASLNDYNVCSTPELPDISTLSTTDDNGVTGAWAVVDNADNTHTYTFTPTDTTCYTGTDFTVTVQTNVEVTFTDLPTANVCEVADLPVVTDLPTTSNENIAGAWTQTDNGDDTYTYTYTVDAGQGCYIGTEFTVTDQTNVEVTFTGLPTSDVCDVADLPVVTDLPTTSDENIIGAWTQTDNGDNTYTYTFTVDAGQGCYIGTDFTATVQTNVEVTFTGLPTADVCDVADLPVVTDLPTTSDENIAGTWTQTDNGDNTYTYTFTVDAGQGCYIGTDFTVSVVSNVQVTFTGLPTADVCDVADLPVVTDLPTTSDENIAGTWIQTDNGDNTYTYTFTVDAGQGCYTGTEFTVSVVSNVEVTFTGLPTADVCDVADLPDATAFPTTSDENITGAWTQTDNGDDTYTYTFTVDAGQGCYIGTDFTVSVVSNVQVTFTGLPTADVCDVADLPVVTDLPTTSDENIAGTWTQADNGDDTYTYTFTVDAGQGCYIGADFTVSVVSNVQVTFTGLPTADVCDVADLPVVTDLPTTSDENIAGTWTQTDNGDNTYTYTFTVDAGQGCYIGTEFTVSVVSNVQVTFTGLPTSDVCDVVDLPVVTDLPTTSDENIAGTWIQTDNGDDTYTYTFTVDAGQGCYIGTDFTVSVVSNVQVTFTDLPTSDVCDVADLPVVTDLATTSDENITGAWTQTDNGDNTYTYTFTVDAGQGCYTGTEFTVSVVSIVQVTFTDLPTSDVCDVADLPVVTDLAITSDENITGAWTQTDNGDDTYTYTFTVDAGQGCYTGTDFTVSVVSNVEVTFTGLPTSDVCDVADLPDPTALPTTSDENITGAWTQTDNGDNTYTYTFTVDAGQGCYIGTDFTVSVTGSVATVFEAYQDANVCDINDVPNVNDLNTFDDNGVEGTWSVVDNGDDSYAYTFVPNDICYLNFVFTINNNPPFPIEFGAYQNSNICDSDELPDVNDLDTTDDNGVPGVWSVNTVGNVTTYTFSPNPDCYTAFAFTYTLLNTVQAEFDTTTFDICEGESFTLPTPNNGVAGTWSPDTYTGAGDYVFTPTSACGVTTTITVTETAEVQAEFDNLTYDICEGETFTFPTPTNGVVGTWSPDTYTGAGDYVFTPTSACGIPTTITVNVTASVQAEFDATTFDICEGETFTFPTPTNGVEGTWSPDTYTGAGDYVFTPTSNCGVPTTITVNETASVQAEFDTTTFDICEGESFTLPSPTNGVDGTWSPDTYTSAGDYVFTPTSACGIPTTITVTVSPATPIVFDNLSNDNVCVIEDLPNINSLPTSDDNSVGGSWTVVDNGDNTHTYIFTPSENCYEEFSFTISITGTTDTVFTEYTDEEVCNVSDLPNTTDLTTTDNNGVAGSWTREQAGDVYTYIFTPNDNCYNAHTFVVTVIGSIDTVFDYIDAEICDISEILNTDDLPSNDNNGVAGVWTSNETGDNYTYIFTPTDDCYNSYQFTLTMTDPVEVTFTNLPTDNLCGTDDLPQVSSLPSQSSEGVPGTWTKLNNGNDSYTYEFNVDADQTCYLGTSFTVQVLSPTTPIFSFDTRICRDDFTANLPSVSDNNITGQWNPSVLNTAFTGTRMYTFTPDDGQCATSLEVFIEIIDCENPEHKIDIPNVITPNHDGLNETWVVDGLIEHYPDAKVQVYNRYNKLLFEAEGAPNTQWDGTYLGRPLPAGDYWYVLDLGNGDVRTGHITVKYE